MKNILFLCNTYYQLIVALQMKMTMFENENVTLLLSDHSINADSIVKKLSKENIFYQIEYIKTRKIDYTSKDLKTKIKTLYNAFFYDDSELFKLLCNKKFDEFFYFNQNLSTNIIYSIMVKNNTNIKCNQYEEGIFSYEAMKNQDILKINSMILKIYCFLRVIFGLKVLLKETKNVYVFYTELYEGNKFINKIQKIEVNSKLTNLLMRIYKLKNIKNYYKQKYIYFSAICDVEGGEPIGEINLVKQIAKLVGKDNLIIKKHPRDLRDVYEKSNFIVDKNSAIPWEVIQLVYDFKDHIFLTATSGSVLTINSLVPNKAKTYFLFNLCNIKNNYIAKKVAELLNNYLKNFSNNKIFKNVFVINKITDILD